MKSSAISSFPYLPYEISCKILPILHSSLFSSFPLFPPPVLQRLCELLQTIPLYRSQLPYVLCSLTVDSLHFFSTLPTYPFNFYSPFLKVHLDWYFIVTCPPNKMLHLPFHIQAPYFPPQLFFPLSLPTLVPSFPFDLFSQSFAIL